MDGSPGAAPLALGSTKHNTTSQQGAGSGGGPADEQRQQRIAQARANGTFDKLRDGFNGANRGSFMDTEGNIRARGENDTEGLPGAAEKQARQQRIADARANGTFDGLRDGFNSTNRGSFMDTEGNIRARGENDTEGLPGSGDPQKRKRKARLKRGGASVAEATEAVMNVGGKLFPPKEEEDGGVSSAVEAVKKVGGKLFGGQGQEQDQASTAGRQLLNSHMRRPRLRAKRRRLSNTQIFAGGSGGAPGLA